MHTPDSVGLDVRLRVAIEIGEAELVDGVYSGAAVDRVLWLRSIAAPAATITSAGTAELLRDWTDDEMVVVPLATVVTRARPQGTAVCALTRPGQEFTGRLEDDAIKDVLPQTLAIQPVERSPKRQVIAESLQYPATLISLSAAGFALIYLVVLASQLGGASLALAVLVIAALASIGTFGWRYSIGYGEAEARREIANIELAEAEAARARARRRCPNCGARSRRGSRASASTTEVDQ